MNQPSRAEVERRAMEVLRQHGLYSLPIDPVQLAYGLLLAEHVGAFVNDLPVPQQMKEMVPKLVGYREPFSIGRIGLLNQDPGVVSPPSYKSCQ